MAKRRPEGILFDVNETLFDFVPLRARFEQAGLPGPALELWLARVLQDGFAHAAAGTFAAFPDLARYQLDRLLAGRPDAATHREHILEGLLAPPAQPDVEPGLERLRRAEVRLATLTNGTVELSARWLDQSGLARYFDRVLDVSVPMLWKPRRQAYVYGATQLGVDPELCALVSVHPWDVHGATCAGLMAAWLDRADAPYPEAMNPPTVAGKTVDEIAQRLLARPRW